MTKERKNEAELDNSNELWNQLKGLDLELFALPGQTLENHASMVSELSTNSELYLVLKTNAALPQLEEKARKLNLVVEQKDKFVVVKHS